MSGKQKRKFKHSAREPENLKRFKQSVEKFAKDQGDLVASGFSETGTLRGKQSRKQVRKEARKLKKMRMHAFKQKKPLPTVESIAIERELKKQKRLLRKKEVDEKIQQKVKLANEKQKKKNEKSAAKRKEEELKEAQLIAIKDDNRMLKQLEKKLKIKSQTLDSVLCSLERTNGLESELIDNDLSIWQDSDLAQTDSSSSKKMKQPTVNTLSNDDEDEGDADVDEEDVETMSENDETGETDQNDDDDSDNSRQDSSCSNDDDEGSNDDKDSDDDNEGNDDDEGSDDDDEARSSEPKEDIYGRLCGDDGQVVRYVPPSKRRKCAASHSDDDFEASDVGRSRQTASTTSKQMPASETGTDRVEVERIKKQIGAFINRLSVSGVQPIGNKIKRLFTEHSRGDCSLAVTEVVLAACLQRALVSQRLVMDHAMLIALLHGSVGMQVSATFLQTLVAKIVDLMTTAYPTKEVENALVMLAHLYNLKVTDCQLVFDVLKKLIEQFKERDVDLILLLLRAVGFGLRKDDPITLKEVIMKLQMKAQQLDVSQLDDQSRIRSLLDAVSAIKNNNVRKLPAEYDVQHLEHLLKLLRSTAQGSLESQVLHISLDDLLSADRNGKWFLVGAAWSGREKDDERGQKQLDEDHIQSVQNRLEKQDVSKDILDLARKQRMNTDTRKNIFCVIMTCEDYVDAFEKLLRLGLKRQQEREIVHVIFDLCLQEKTYNAFYAYLAQKFCEYDRSFLMSVQVSIWDRLKVLHEMPYQKINNMADTLSQLVATKALSLSVFKVVEFRELNKATVILLKRVLHQLLVGYSEETTLAVFKRITAIDKLQALRDGLKLFLQHFVVGKKPDKLLLERARIADRAMNSY